VPAESPLHRHRLANFALPSGATRRHRLAHPSRTAKRPLPSRPPTSLPRLAEPTLLLGALRI